MKKNRLIFYAVFAAWHLFVLCTSIYVKTKSTNLEFLWSLLSKIPIFIYGSIFGLTLLLIDFIWSWRISKQQEAHDAETLLENNTLKAKIYDLQEEQKVAPTITPK